MAATLPEAVANTPSTSLLAVAFALTTGVTLACAVCLHR